jgi:hypothetical protein
MMPGKAGLDAFLQSWNDVWQSIKKDDPIPAILLMFCKFPNDSQCAGLIAAFS